jgi:hypothetical protein
MATAQISEAEILVEAIAPRRGNMSTAVAESVLKWKLSARALQRMKTLLNRNASGKLTTTESAELDGFRRVGLLLDLVHAKAQLSLQRSRATTS